MKNYLTLEGVFLFSCLVLAIVPFLLKYYGIELGENTGIGRSLNYPMIILLHSALVLIALILMARYTRTRSIVLMILGIAIFILGGYSLWWPGYLSTSYFATLGGGFLTAKSIKRLLNA